MAKRTGRPVAAGPPRLALRRAETARAMGISLRMLDELVRAGAVPHVRLSPKLIVFPVASLEAWLSQRAAARKEAP